MVKFTRSSSKDSRTNSSRGAPRGRSSSTRSPRSNSRGGRFSDREPKRFSRNRRDVKMTKVTCASCGVECEVPFNPTSNKPVYCSDCFKKPSKDSKNNETEILIKNLEQELELVNEKLEKIMRFLGI